MGGRYLISISSIDTYQYWLNLERHLTTTTSSTTANILLGIQKPENTVSRIPKKILTPSQKTAISRFASFLSRHQSIDSIAINLRVRFDMIAISLPRLRLSYDWDRFQSTLQTQSYDWRNARFQLIGIVLFDWIGIDLFDWIGIDHSDWLDWLKPRSGLTFFGPLRIVLFNRLEWTLSIGLELD